MCAGGVKRKRDYERNGSNFHPCFDGNGGGRVRDIVSG